MHHIVSVRQMNFLFQVALSTHPWESEFIVDVCILLVSYGCNIHADGVSPLHEAVRHNSPPVVDALLSASLKFPDTVTQALATVDETGYVPLHTAVRYGYLECCRQLIDAGADVNAMCQNMFGGYAVTALELAVVRRNKDAVRLLLKSPSCQVDKVGSRKATALLHATSRGLTMLR